MIPASNRPSLTGTDLGLFNPFAHSLRASLDALAASDPSVTREAQGGRGHGVSGDRAVQCDHAALS